ncbi:helix-turn-helix domain-containing protein [Thermoactinomyces mirandus]|uniref:Helix-turn-helix transcriptional regulator n=1 Tax=Thermoactinomyces mirandus TaxID=2756294 RepID=A0A7W1XU16_9BACL|nr:helix-turn-helix transcriptional regulator [Thermoactinomyces mirandus]MBA4603282.1 helix-turn-helix transcriptional regulator [Thermoactinomyces mirandus]
MDTPNMKCILNDLLKEKGWTQKKLSVETGIPQSILSVYGKSGVTNYNINYLFAIKRMLGLNNIDELFIEN